MTHFKSAIGVALATTALTLASVTALPAQGFDIVAFAPPEGKGPNKDKGGDGGGDPPPPPPSTTYYDWMDSDVQGVWDTGAIGVGATVTVVDDYSSGDIFEGNLDGAGVILQHHGDWTSDQVRLLAPGANVVERDWTSNGPVKMGSGFNVLNLSYGMIANDGLNVDNLLWSKREQTIIDAATSGSAFVAKSSGNDWGAAVGTAVNGTRDYLNEALIGAASAVFVGALRNNGDDNALASIASYSTIAGSNETVQAQFLVVGVEGGETTADELANYGADCGAAAGHCLYGTSFAAPVVAGYAALLGGKFGTEDPLQIKTRLLTTTDRDTLVDLGATGWGAEDFATYGQGEANVLRAMSVNSPLTAN